MISSSMAGVSTVDQNDNVLALNVEGGVTLWTQTQLLHRNLTAPVLYNGSLVVGDSEGYLHWMDTDNGRFVAQQKWTAPASRLSRSWRIIKIPIRAKDGTLYAISR